MIHTDSFFCIGSTHDVCQDYAFSGSWGSDRHAVIVSDGCSSSPDTDFGSRLLVKAKEHVLLFGPGGGTGEFSGQDAILLQADRSLHAVRLSRDCLNATLMTAEYHKETNKVCVEVYGDGVVVARKRHTHEYVVCSLEFRSGAPYYLRYQMSPHAKEAYLKKFGFMFQEKKYCITSTGEILSECGAAFDQANYNVDAPWESEFDAHDFDMVAVLTDGIHSFQQRVETATSVKNDPVPFLQVVKQVMAFKNYNGVFVKRRCARAMKEFTEKGIFHYDDFSMGAIYIGETE